MTDKVIAYTTCSDKAEAEKLARHLVEERLAACVSVLPGVKSFYRWQGEDRNRRRDLVDGQDLARFGG